MKLNKEVCKACFYNYSVHNHNNYKGIKFIWTENDEERWKLKEVFCPHVFRTFIHNPTTSIYELPDECLYKLEHLILKET